MAYIPVDRIVGISKLARLTDIHAKVYKTDELQKVLLMILSNHSCAVIMEARHGCMSCRGVMKQNAVMTTSAMRGVFLFVLRLGRTFPTNPLEQWALEV